jgi:hypothetical protein
MKSKNNLVVEDRLSEEPEQERTAVVNRLKKKSITLLSRNFFVLD